MENLDIDMQNIDMGISIMDMETLLPKQESKDRATKPLKKSRRSRSCCEVFLYTVLFLIGLTTTVAVALGIWGYKVMGREVIRFTVTTPLSFESTDIMDEDDCNVEKERAELFFDMLVAGQEPIEDLSFSAATINGCFIAYSDYLRGNMFVSLEEKDLSVKMSLPAYFLPNGNHRYFVAEAELNLGPTTFSTRLDTLTPVEGISSPTVLAKFDTHQYEDEEFDFEVQYGKFLNWYVPQDYIEQRENIMDYLYEDPEIAPILSGVQGLSINHDMITIHVRRSGDEVNDKTENNGMGRRMTNYYGIMKSASSSSIQRFIGF